jgi:hypothetical protein
MSWGLTITNPGGELVVDSDAKGMHYVGQATYSANVVWTNNTFVHNRYHRRYSVTLANSAALPVVAIRPTTDRWLSVQKVFRSAPGSATWYIDCYSADASMTGSSIADMTVTATAEVHVFSTHPGAGTDYGLCLYDAAGNMTWDFGARPLFIRQVLAFPLQTVSATYRPGDAMALLGGLTTPLILNAAAHGKDNVAIGAVGTHEDSEYVFQTDGAGNLKRVRLPTFWERGEEVDGTPYTPQPDWALPARTLFVIDGADYA